MARRLFTTKVARGISVALITTSVGAMLVSVVIGQQAAKAEGWQTYSPIRASFSMQIPGVALPAQGHIFDSAYEKKAPRLIAHGSRARIYNFEIEKGGQRKFLVSILDVQIGKRPPQKFITGAEVKFINDTIGDGIVHPQVERRETRDGELSRWSYNIQGGVGDDDEDDGVVLVKRWGARMVIVVVDYDYAKAGDADVEAMLESLRLR